jgi:signal transduction histidine kinase
MIRIKRLQNKFLLGAIGLVMLLGLSVVIFLQNTLTEKLEIELQKRGLFFVENLARESINIILTENLLELQILLNDQKSILKDVEYIFVVDTLGEVLAHTFQEGFPIDLKKANIVSIGEKFSIQSMDTEKGVILDIAKPLLKGSVGVVHVGLAEGPIKKVVANIIGKIFGIIFIIIIIGIGGAKLLAIVMTIPISEITAVVKAVGDGDLGQKVQVKTNDEIGDLGVAFNKMINDRKQAEEKLLIYQEKLRSLSSELFLAEERERRRIATGLHDRIGQNLVYSKIKLASIQKTLPLSSRSTVLDEICELIEQMISETRSLTFELSPPVLYELGLEPAIEWLTEQNQAQHGFTTEFYDDGQHKPLDVTVSVFLFHATRELLFNIVKHSRARSSKVAIHKEGDNIRVQIEDDGIGFKMSGSNSEESRSSGFGLFSIRERLSSIGGRIEIKTGLGQGTRIVLLAPLQH